MTRRRSPAAFPWALAAVLGALVASLLVSPVLAGHGWTFTMAPSSIIVGDPSTVRLTVRNVASKDIPETRIGCIEVQVPRGVHVSSVWMMSVTHGHAWRVSFDGSVITAHATGAAERLEGGAKPEAAVIGVRVKGSRPGEFTLRAAVSSDIDCAAESRPSRTRTLTVKAPLVTPRPTPGPTPTAEPSRRPDPSPTPGAGSPDPGASAAPGASPGTSSSAGPSASTLASPAASVPTASRPPGRSSAAPPSGSGGGATPAAGATSCPPAAPAVPASPGASPQGAASSPGAAAAPGCGASGFVVGQGPGEGSVQLASVTLDFTGELSAWIVPGALLTTPGLLVLVAIAFQALGGAAWLPVARRRLGDFGLIGRSRRRR